MSQPAAPPTDGKSTRAGQQRSSSPQRRQGVFARLAWLVGGVAYLAIGFAFACPQDFRNESPAYVVVATAAFMIRTFLFHLGLLLCAIGLGAALIRRWRLLVATLPLVCFCIGPALWSHMPPRRPTISGETITVMSVNVLGANQNTAALVAEVVATKPDVLLLQEYRPHWHRAFQAALATDYPHVDCAIRNDNFGLAIYSRYPFAEPVDAMIPLGTIGVPQARAVVRIAERDVAFYNVHLMPPKSLDQTIEQRREFADLLDQLKRGKLPIILCGDFNFTNASTFADELKRLGLIDTHVLSGRGRGVTWPRRSVLRWLPGIRLDHIFISRELTSAHSRTGIGRGSDHRPVVAEIGLAR